MKLKLISYGIAKDILKAKSLDYTLENGNTIGQLKNELTDKFPDFTKLTSLKFAVGAEYQNDDFVLSEANEVVIIPPVSGG